MGHPNSVVAERWHSCLDDQASRALVRVCTNELKVSLDGEWDAQVNNKDLGKEAISCLHQA